MLIPQNNIVMILSCKLLITNKKTNKAWFSKKTVVEL
jgi:hypothetical protein